MKIISHKLNQHRNINVYTELELFLLIWLCKQRRKLLSHVLKGKIPGTALSFITVYRCNTINQYNEVCHKRPRF